MHKSLKQKDLVMLKYQEQSSCSSTELDEDSHFYSSSLMLHHPK